MQAVIIRSNQHQHVQTHLGMHSSMMCNRAANPMSTHTGINPVVQAVVYTTPHLVPLCEVCSVTQALQQVCCLSTPRLQALDGAVNKLQAHVPSRGTNRHRQQHERAKSA